MHNEEYPYEITEKWNKDAQEFDFWKYQFPELKNCIINTPTPEGIIDFTNLPQNIKVFGSIPPTINLILDQKFSTNTYKVEKEKEEDMNLFFDAKPGFIIIHQYVGNMSPLHADSFCQMIKARFTESKEFLEFKEKFPNWNFALLPSKTESSYVEVYHEEDGERENVMGEIANLVQSETMLVKDTIELKNQAIDYALMMLGAPVVKIELDQSQLDFCYMHSVNLMNDAALRNKKYNLTDSYFVNKKDILFEGVLAHAMHMLENVRKSEPVPEDAQDITKFRNENLRESAQRLKDWRGYLAAENS